jgi:hypothetical protein
VWNGGSTLGGGELYVGIHAFPSPADASAFMAVTVQQGSACGPGLVYQLAEGDGVGFFDGFSDVDSGPTWTITDNVGASPSVLPGTDEAFQLDTMFTATTIHRGRTYTIVDGNVILYERRGSIVLVYDLWGEWEVSGFDDVDTSLLYRPTRADLDAAITTLRPAMIGRLQAAGLVG